MASLEVDKKQIEKAVKALGEYVQKTENKDIASNIEADDIQMQLGFQKIPKVHNKIISVSLPKSILCETSEVCLFVKDLDKKKRDYEPTVEHYQDLLQKHGVKGISQVIPLKQIKLEYKPYEAKRNLSNMYDKFLADESIVRLLPGLLGKSFYGRKRYPIQVNMDAKNLKTEIDRALHKTQCIVSGRGSTCQVTVAHSAMETKDTVENVLTAVKRLSDTIPGGMKNVKTLHLKTMNSPSLPIYLSPDSVNDVELPPKPTRIPLDEPEEITTLMDAKVRVTPHGRIHIIQDMEDDKETNNGTSNGDKAVKEEQPVSSADDIAAEEELEKLEVKSKNKSKTKDKKLAKQKTNIKGAEPSAKRKKVNPEVVKEEQPVSSGDDNTAEEELEKQEVESKKKSKTKQKTNIKGAEPSAKKKKLNPEVAVDCSPPTERRSKRKVAKAK